MKGQELKVYKLKKDLYGLKQAPRALYNRIDSYLLNNGFKRSNNESTLNTKTNQRGNLLIIYLYVDDMIYTGNLRLADFKTVIKKELEMTCLGLMRYILGIEVDQSKKGIFICQFKKYVTIFLARFRVRNGKPANTPISIGTKLSKEDKGSSVNHTLYKLLVGSLTYLTAIRPDIMYVVNLMSKFMESPKGSHWKVEKRVLRYIASTTQHGIHNFQRKLSSWKHRQ